jgi:hypothetical protein
MNTIEITFNKVNLIVDYDYSPEEPTVWRYSNGDGHPGSPAYVDILDIHVQDTSILEVFSDDLLEKLEEKILDEHS